MSNRNHLVIRESNLTGLQLVYDGPGEINNWRKHLNGEPIARDYFLTQIEFSDCLLEQGFVRVFYQSLERNYAYQPKRNTDSINIPIDLTPGIISSLQQIIDLAKQSQLEAQIGDKK